MEKLFLLLDKQVANFAVLFTKLHHHHWYVKGTNFFSLHEKFEQYYDEVNELYDEFAERLLTIGGVVSSTMKDYLKLTSLKEVDKTLSANEMVSMILDDFNQIVAELKEGIKLADALDDQITVDMFVATVSKLEKHAWMLRFFLEK